MDVKYNLQRVKSGNSFEDLGYSPFDETETYAAGDVVIYGGSLYKFTASHTGAWTVTDATATSVEELIKDGADAMNHFKGYFNSLVDLQAKYPTGEIGDFANVYDSTTDKTYRYVWDASISTPNWVQALDSSSQPIEVTPSTSTFATGQSVVDTSIVNNLTIGGTNDVLSAEQGKVLKQELTQLDQEVNGSEGWVDVDLQPETNRYYQYIANSDSVKVASQTLAYAACARISVNPGDKFKIFGFDKATAESVTRLWCFSDGTIVTEGGVDYYSVLEVAADKINTRETGAIITAPNNAAYLTICFQSYDSTQDKLQKWQKVDNGLAGDVADLEERVEELESQSFPQVVDNLNSTSTTDALSAAQGKILGDEVFGEASWDVVDLTSILISDSCYNTQTGSSEPYGVASQATPIDGYSCFQIAVTPGDKFKIYGTGYWRALKLWAFADANDLRLTCEEDHTPAVFVDGEEFTAPANAVRLVVNFISYNSATDKLFKFSQAESLDYRITALEHAQTKKSVLDGKTFIVFGDSLSEFTNIGTGKTWCQYAEEIAGATFVNIGIGGTQVKSRVPMTHIFDSSTTYQVNDYVYHLDNGHYHFYKCTTQHTGAWDANDFTELTNDAKMYVGLDMVNLVTMACNTSVVDVDVRFADAAAAADCVKTNTPSHDDNTAQITRLKAVDWSKVDAIIIMGGTNDFDGSSFGNSDSTVITSEAGAINIIVSQLSTSYGLKPIYFVKEPVKWFPETVDDARTYPDDHWCDVFARGGMALAQFFNQIEEQFNVVNHIPVCDLYYGLAWNKQNFWNYFDITKDGTHPYKGFRQIAEKIVSFIIANKVF